MNGPTTSNNGDLSTVERVLALKRYHRKGVWATRRERRAKQAEKEDVRYIEQDSLLKQWLFEVEGL